MTWSSPVEVARGAGQRGPWQQNDSVYDYVDDPTIAFAADGAAIVAWVDQRKKDVLLQIFDPSGQARSADPVDVSRTPEVFSWLPRVAISPAERHIYVLWQEIVFSGGSHGGDIYFARSVDGGRSFEAPLDLSRSPPGDGKGRVDKDKWSNGSLDIAVGPDGAIFAAWTEYDGPLWIARSDDLGVSFTAPIAVHREARAPARAPALAVTNDRVYLAWTLGEDAAADIRLSVSRDRGATFAPPTIVAETASYSDAPKIVVGADGVLHLVNTEAASNGALVPEVWYRRSHDGGTTFEPGRAIAYAAGESSLAVEGARVVATYEAYAPLAEGPRGLGIVYSQDGGDTFSEAAPIPGSRGQGHNGSFQGRLMKKLVMRGDSIAVVNSAMEHGSSSRVWLLRGTLPRN